MPGESLSLLPLIQLPHRVIPHRPPLLCRGDCGGGRGAEGPIVDRACYTADAVWSHHAITGQSAVALWAAGRNLSTVAGHVPGQRLVGCNTVEETRHSDNK